VQSARNAQLWARQKINVSALGNGAIQSRATLSGQNRLALRSAKPQSSRVSMLPTAILIRLSRVLGQGSYGVATRRPYQPAEPEGDRP